MGGCVAMTVDPRTMDASIFHAFGRGITLPDASESQCVFQQRTEDDPETLRVRKVNTIRVLTSDGLDGER